MTLRLLPPPEPEDRPAPAPAPDAAPVAPPPERASPLSARVQRLCHPAREAHGGFTFLPRPGEDAAHAWEIWLAAHFLPRLLPLLPALHAHAVRDEPEEIRSLDLALDPLLPPQACAASRHAGALLLDALAHTAGLRAPLRLRHWRDQGRTPAHFPTVFLLHCGIFHFPLRQSLLDYLHHEWLAATSDPAPIRNLQPRLARQIDHELTALAHETQLAPLPSPPRDPAPPPFLRVVR